MPAIDGSALTNLNFGILKSTTNPAIDSNPSGGVGTLWVNKITGQIYNCTDATADANVWKNIGSGTGAIEPFSLQGSSYGFASGGNEGGNFDEIQKFAFSSANNATDHGDLGYDRKYVQGHSSGTDGYLSGGSTNPGGNYDRIQKFSFSSSVTASTDHGTLSRGNFLAAEWSTPTGYGYTGAGGWGNDTGIDKWSFSNNTTAVEVGSLTNIKKSAASCGTTTQGFYCGGSDDGPAFDNYLSTIAKFDYASNVASEDHGDLTAEREDCTGTSSTTHGFVSSGYHSAGNSGSPGNTQYIDKFQFATGSTAAEHGEMTLRRRGSAGHSSVTEGYWSGGDDQINIVNTIDKFNYATAGTAADIGDLFVVQKSHGGHQV